jgi:hypothetical protein
MKTKTWTVELFLSEEGSSTHARAVLHTGEGEGREIVGTGHSRRNPHDPAVPEIGDEVAAARALTALGSALLDVATDDIAGVTEKPALLLH